MAFDDFHVKPVLTSLTFTLVYDWFVAHIASIADVREVINLRTLSAYLASNHQIIELLVSLGIIEATKAAIPNLVNSVGEKIKPSKEDIKAWFNRKDSKIIAGRVRRWLEGAWKEKEN